MIILVVALLVIGPKKLPDIARTLGKAMGEFRRMSNDVRQTIEKEIEQDERQQAVDKAKKEIFEEPGKSDEKPEEESPVQADAQPEEVDLKTEEKKS
jgi:sec-independent protein translocase protein TatB